MFEKQLKAWLEENQEKTPETFSAIDETFWYTLNELINFYKADKKLTEINDK